MHEPEGEPEPDQSVDPEPVVLRRSEWKTK